jgi:hypothetical protein
LRLAGVLLLLNAGLGLVAKLQMPEKPGTFATVQTAVVAVDGLLGLMLLLGLEALRPLAILRALGSVGLAAYFYANELMPVTAGVHAAYALGLLLLLVGSPGAARGALGAVCSLASLGAAGFLLLGTLRGNNPLGQFALLGQIESAPALTVEGVAVPYRLTLPNDRWYLVLPEVTRKEHADADRWLVRPDRDAHIRVVAMQMPSRGQVVQMSAAQVNQAFVDSLRRTAAGVQAVDGGTVRAGSRVGPLTHVSCTLNGVAQEWYATSFVQGTYVIRLEGVARPVAFPAVKDEILQTFASFTLP